MPDVFVVVLPPVVPLVVVVVVPDVPVETAVATVWGVTTAAVAMLELVIAASWEVVVVARPKGVMKVGLALSVVVALPAITVTCDGRA